MTIFTSIHRFVAVKKFVLPGIIFLAVPLFSAYPSKGEDDSSAALWQYYPPLTISTASSGTANRNVVQQQTRVPEIQSEEAPSEENSANNGFTPQLDPQFDTAARPSWRPPRVDKPMIERPTYDVPGYDAPMYRLEQVNKPVVDRPIYVAPFVNPPNNSVQYIEAPAEIAPTLATPAYHAPDYVVKPDDVPAYDAPTIDQSGIEYRPEAYSPPVYQPDEYRPPRELPPEYMPPPEE